MKRNITIALIIVLGFMPEVVLADTAQAPAGEAKPKPRVVSPKPPPARTSNGHTTIAPFPVPGDTSSAATEWRKTLNIPKQGVTTIAPLPIPPGASWDPYGMAVTLPQQVDVFPEASLTSPPSYPDAARNAGIQGTVRLMAHVRTDGTVDSVRIIHSIAGLDSAAVTCVKQWRFRPASYHGKPVAVWVGIPVKFTLH